MLNFKGGVGKTTSTVNLGAAMAGMNKKVLIIDLDVQGTATSTYSKQSPYDGETIYDFLVGKTKSAFAYETKIPNLDYVPSSEDMRYVEMELNRKREREHILSKFVDMVSGEYDFILLDCPPGKSIVTDNAMVAADEVIIPVNCEPYSMYGLRDILKEAEDVKESNPKLHVLGILANEYEGHTSINRGIIESLNKEFPGLVFDTRIRKNVAVKEFSVSAQSVLEYDKRSNGAKDYIAFAHEVMGKLGGRS